MSRTLNRLKHTVILMVILVTIKGNAQTVEANYKTPIENVPAGVTITHDPNLHVQTQVLSEANKDAMYNEFINQTTHRMEMADDFYNAPMNHVKLKGKNKLDYLYSGDVTDNESIGSEDPQAIYMGTKNERAKVQLNEDITSADGAMLEKYISGEIERLPGQALMDINATPQEKKNLLIAFMNRTDFKAEIKTILNTPGGDCEFASLYGENRGRGVEFTEKNINYTPNVDYKQAEGNMPIFGVGTNRVLPGYSSGHAINGMYTGESNNTNMLNILKFDNLTMIEPQTGEVQNIGDERLNDHATIGYTKPIIINQELIGFSSGRLTFDLKNKDSPKVTNFGFGYALTNPKAIQTDFIEKDQDIINYSSNLDLSNMGIPDIKTNADLVSKIEIGEGIYKSDTRNIMMKTIIDGGKTSLSENPELANINFKQNKEIIISYLQEDKNSFDKNSYVLLKEEKFNTSIIVDDLEAPQNGMLSQTSDKAEPGISPDELAKKYVTHDPDNSGLAVDTITSYSETPTWSDNLYDYYDVNVALMDKRGNEANVGNFEAGIRKFPTGIEELNATKSFDLDQNYPNPVTGSTTIPYASMGGDLDFKLIDVSGVVRKVIEKENTHAGEATFQLDIRDMKPGQYILMGSDDKGSKDKIEIIKR